MRGIVLPHNTITSINNIPLTFRSLDGIYFDFDVSFLQTFLNLKRDAGNCLPSSCSFQYIFHVASVLGPE
jgi:hypothetical protein